MNGNFTFKGVDVFRLFGDFGSLLGFIGLMGGSGMGFAGIGLAGIAMAGSGEVGNLTSDLGGLISTADCPKTSSFGIFNFLRY